MRSERLGHVAESPSKPKPDFRRRLLKKRTQVFRLRITACKPEPFSDGRKKAPLRVGWLSPPSYACANHRYAGTHGGVKFKGQPAAPQGDVRTLGHYTVKQREKVRDIVGGASVRADSGMSPRSGASQDYSKVNPVDEEAEALKPLRDLQLQFHDPRRPRLKTARRLGRGRTAEAQGCLWTEPRGGRPGQGGVGSLAKRCR